MKRKKRSILFWLSLLVYGIALTGVLLYFRYPAVKVERYLAVHLSTIAQGAKVDIERCGYALPARMRCDNLRFSQGQSDEELLVVDNLGITPVISRSGLFFRVSGEAVGGTFSADAEVSPGQDSLLLNELEVNGVDLARLPSLHQGMQREVKGFLDFRGTMSVSRTGVKAQEGRLIIRDGILPFRQQILLVEQQGMQPLEVQMAYNDGRMVLHDGSVQGEQLVFSFGGELQATGSLSDWGMNLTGTIVASPEYVAANPPVQRVVRRLQRQFQGNNLPYMVSGSLRMPRFRFGGQ